MRYSIRHVTRYQYPVAVTQAMNLGYLIPRTTARQQCLSNQVSVSPQVATSMTREDYFGNQAFHFTVENSHQTLEVVATSQVDVRAAADWPSLNIGSTCAQVRDRLASSKELETLLAREYVLASPMIAFDQQLADFATPFLDDDRPFLSSVRELSAHIYDQFSFDPGFSGVSTPVSEVFKHRKGVCQDFAHLAIACLRSLGYPARYVSGYLETLPPPGQTKLVGSDATHAWFEVYSPGEGWFEFDPTNNSIPGEQHIVTAWGRDYTDVTPLKGVVFGGGRGHSLSVSVDVNRV
ncbi:transglutaminase family protein [Arenicella xantha]|uniref:Transglutaminase-like putative cysteine protease n=1 Tax=Arenicella xantha TaxID=644221 RepID=A0A395JN89_9GAMM|nr:transglutaminase family protein [Arenicella xantha]RBP51267.1 transglutaminase-like putative cysteine protease [Arenicella xantha]